MSTCEVARRVLEAGKGSRKEAGGVTELMSNSSRSIELGRHSAWAIDRVKDHAWKIGSGVTPNGGAASYLASGVPLLRSQNIHFDGLRLDDVAYIGEDTHAEMSGTQLRSGDVLLNITGASIGRCTFVPEGFGEGNVNQHVCIIRPSSKIDHRFLTYCLSAPWGQDQIFSSFTGASRQGLGLRDLGEIQIPVPPLSEQERIAAYLDASCTAIDAAVAAKSRQLETLDGLRRTIIQETVTKGLNPSVEMRNSDIDWLPEIPKHWNRAKLKRHVQMIRGQFSHRPRNDPAFYDGPYPFIQTGSISATDKFITEFTQTLNEDGLRISKLFPANTVVMTITGAKIAEVAVTTFDACFPDSIVGFVPDHRLNRDYLYYLLVAMKPALLREMVVTTQPQLFVAFTATPAPATLTLFGASFDVYSEAEAIAEGYIVDVATGIISYKTLYNLHCPIVPKPDEETLYPKGVVAKALQNVAFQDDGLIQYKAEVMLRIFEKDVKPLIDGRAKAMIVATSRVAGLRYFDILKEKLKERGADYKVLYAFSDFVHPETNKAVSEHAVNELKDGELIENRFKGDETRLMIVASKFQTGFDQPLLAGMFLDKPVVDRNAVQTVSRLNRCHEGKRDVVVVDFTNNASAILKAFAKYRKGTPFVPEEPDPELCTRLHAEVLAAGVFTQTDAHDFVKLVASGTDAQVQFAVNGLRVRFQAKLASPGDRKTFVYTLARLAKSFHFLTCFFSYPDEVKEFVAFAEVVGPQLIKQGSVSELMKQIRRTDVVKAAVEYQGEVRSGGGTVKLRPGGGRKGVAPPPKKVSVQDMINEIRTRFNISDEEALYIKQVTELKVADPTIRGTVQAHRNDVLYLESAYRGQVNGEIKVVYDELGRYEDLADSKYTDTGGIFDIMAITVIQTHLAA